MLKFRMQSTDEYERLVKFFVENELEFNGDEEVDTDIIKCWKVTHTDDVLIAGCVLAQRQGKYIIDGIAVTKMFRKFGIGKILVDKVVKEIKARGGKELYLVARAPGFFKTMGFETVKPEDAPVFFECGQCPQYQIKCFPEIMKLEIE
ncbi:MAG: GNAT family N-acetyltransferase [Firmicutes bacterium]|nr:GNAT family N-acetyltransferase [Bacillota bacterium]